MPLSIVASLPAILPSVACSPRGMRSHIIPLNAPRRSVNPAEKRTTCARGSSHSFFASGARSLHSPRGSFIRRTSGSRSFHPRRPNELDYAHRISSRWKRSCWIVIYCAPLSIFLLRIATTSRKRGENKRKERERERRGRGKKRRRRRKKSRVGRSFRRG